MQNIQRLYLQLLLHVCHRRRYEVNVSGLDALAKLPNITTPPSGCLTLILCDRDVILCNYVLDFQLRATPLPDMNWEELYTASVALKCLSRAWQQFPSMPPPMQPLAYDVPRGIYCT